jgi:hypothetical protein
MKIFGIDFLTRNRYWSLRKARQVSGRRVIRRPTAALLSNPGAGLYEFGIVAIDGFRKAHGGARCYLAGTAFPFPNSPTTTWLPKSDGT